MAESELSPFRQKLVPYRRQFGQSFYISVFLNLATAVIGAEVGTDIKPMLEAQQALLIVATLTFGALWLFSVRWRDADPDPS